jgi:hypothetical protein
MNKSNEAQNKQPVDYENYGSVLQSVSYRVNADVHFFDEKY